MGETQRYEKIFKSIIDSVQYIKQVDSDKDMADAYKDNYVTKEQRLRDKKVTELLDLYVSGYRYKNISNRWYKGILLGVACAILLVLTGVFVFLILQLDFSEKKISVTYLVEAISVCVTFLSLIIGILTIITKYVFPENEEEYITRIVGIIQNNDLENKKENIRVQLKEIQEKTEDNDKNISIIG